MTIVDGANGTKSLKKQLEKMFKVVDILEEEFENTESLKKEALVNDLEVAKEKMVREKGAVVEEKKR